MHAVGLHSALAIKRQRKRRDEQRRARERRYSAQSGESGLTSPRASTGSLDRHHRHHQTTQQHHASGQGMLDSKVVTSIGMLHIGVVFLVLGGFLLGSGLLPGDLANWSFKGSGGWWNELVATGLFAVLVGIFLIVLNRVIAKKEEDDLEEYVQRQLTRSKSGHRLERDVETGGLTTRHARKAKQLKKMTSCSSIEVASEKTSSSPPRSPPPAYSPPPVVNGDHHTAQTALFLEQITEEEAISDRLETSTTNSLSPGTPSETRELLHNNSRHYKHNGNHNPQHNHHYHHRDDHQPIYVNPVRN